MNIYEHERALFIIEKYLYELKSNVGIRHYWDKRVFEQQSHEIWAVKELYLFVKHHENLSPIEAVTLFADEMDNFASTEKTGWRFSIAYDISMDVLDMLLTQL